MQWGETTRAEVSVPGLGVEGGMRIQHGWMEGGVAMGMKSVTHRT